MTKFHKKHIALMTVAVMLSSCRDGTNRPAAATLLGYPYTIEYFDCNGRISGGNSERAADSDRGEKSTISLSIKVSSDLKQGSHGVGIFDLSDSTRMDFDYFETGLIDDFEIQFGRQSQKPSEMTVAGRILKGTGYMEIAWDYKRGGVDKFLWRGRCNKIENPPLVSVKQEEKIKH